MKPHTSSFKTEMSKMGRQIKTEITIPQPPFIRLETSAITNIITEDNNEIITDRDQTPGTQPIFPYEIPEEDIYLLEIVRNGKLLQSLMTQCNFEAKININIGYDIRVRLGVLVGNSYEYIYLGEFKIYSKEYNAENETWKYICYDRMLLFMVKYSGLNISYPITIRDYISAIANKFGVIFANASQEFTNYDKLINRDYFRGANVTYRDILDKLSEITASNIICDGQLQIKYPAETNDIIDEVNLKDVNVNFEEQFGPINQIYLVNKENNTTWIVKDDTSIQENGVTQITITNNPLMFNGEEEKMCNNILNKLKETPYSINDFTTTGLCYYDFLDLFTVSIKETNYKCLLLNNEIKIKQGIQESIFTERSNKTTTETNNFQNNSVNNKDIQTNIEQLNDDKISRNNVINAINQSSENSKIIPKRIIFEKTIDTTTDANGFIETNLGKNQIFISATASFENNNYGFIMPFYHYNNGLYEWKIKLEDINKNAIANTNITITIYYLEK